MPNTLTTFVDVAKSGQYALDPSPCSNTASPTVKKGCPITPITQSVVAKQARAMLLMVFRRSLVFTANMTSAFEMLVMGKQIRFMIIRYTITVYASVVLSFNVPPKKVTNSHSVLFLRSESPRFGSSSLFCFTFVPRRDRSNSSSDV